MTHGLFDYLSIGYSSSFYGEFSGLPVHCSLTWFSCLVGLLLFEDCFQTRSEGSVSTCVIKLSRLLVTAYWLFKVDFVFQMYVMSSA